MVKPRKLMFVLPNLFTVSSIFCGFYALTLCAGEAGPPQLYQAALAILFAQFFDGFDGRVARMTKTQSDFGVELDSLADVISFGVVPGMLVYKWALAPLGFTGILISFAFTACGALRLARFNVLAHRSPEGGASKYFVGLPIPLASGTIVSMVVAHYGLTEGAEVGPQLYGPIAAIVLMLALLMVSTVRYRTFKDLRPSPRSAGALLAVCAGGVVVALLLDPAFVLAAYFSVYLALGIAESALLLGRRFVTARVGGGAALVVDEDEDDEDERDYL